MNAKLTMIAHMISIAKTMSVAIHVIVYYVAIELSAKRKLTEQHAIALQECREILW